MRIPRLEIGSLVVGFSTLFALDGCDERKIEPTEFDEPALNEGRTRVQQTLGNAQVVFVGEVVSLGTPPAIKTGPFPVYQTVAYKVSATLKGSIGVPEGTEVVVAHHVIGGTRSTGPSEANELSRELFKPGRSLIVAVKGDKQQWMDLDESYGTIPATDQNLSLTKRILEASPTGEKKS